MSRLDRYAAYGGSIDALYEVFGVVAFANEIYQMGEDDDGDNRIEDHERLRYDDEVLGGKAFKEWQAFDHPQLGAVEIGGWRKFGQNNPFPEQLPEEVRRNVEFVLMQARNTPLLEISKLEAESLGGDVYRLQATVANTSFGPTELAIRSEQGRAVPVRAEVGGEGVEVLSTDNTIELGVLAGYEDAEAEWLIRAAAGTVVAVKAWHPRAGRVVSRRSCDEY